MTTDDFTTAARAEAEQKWPYSANPDPTPAEDEDAALNAGFMAGAEWARTHLAAHDARVRRDAARSALDGYADAEEDSFLPLHVKGAPLSAAQCTHAAMTAREYRDTHYPETEG